MGRRRPTGERRRRSATSTVEVLLVVSKLLAAGDSGTTMARVSFRSGLDVAHLAVVSDDGTVLAQATRRATSVSPGPAAWTRRSSS
jgi:hypothetical protein